MKYEEWVEFLKRPGAKGTMQFEWLDKPCPKCGAEVRWEVTGDGYAYCRNCSFGTSTDGIWINGSLKFYAEGTFHCFMCEGWGERDGEFCEDCNGRKTRR